MIIIVNAESKEMRLYRSQSTEHFLRQLIPVL
jgi:hypothetical protein